jgi:hypothetical protein
VCCLQISLRIGPVLLFHGSSSTVTILCAAAFTAASQTTFQSQISRFLLWFLATLKVYRFLSDHPVCRVCRCKFSSRCVLSCPHR